MTQGTVLIAGAGHAGFQVAASLRQHGYRDRICLINDEAHLPYQRPPLSKAYLKSGGAPDSLMFRPDKFYRDQNIELISDRAVSIDRAARRLLLASGTALDYGHLALATGARIVQIGTLGGARGEIALGPFMAKRLSYVGTVLRSRPLDEKIALAREFQAHVVPLFGTGALQGAVDRTFALDEIADAHRHMEADRNFGKVLLAIG